MGRMSPVFTSVMPFAPILQMWRLRGSTMCPKGQCWRGEGTTQSMRFRRSEEQGSIRGRAQRGGPWGRKQQVQTRVILLPEDEVGTVDLAPAAAVL